MKYKQVMGITNRNRCNEEENFLTQREEIDIFNTCNIIILITVDYDK